MPKYPVHGHPAMIEIPLATYREMQSEIERLKAVEARAKELEDQLKEKSDD